MNTTMRILSSAVVLISVLAFSPITSNDGFYRADVEASKIVWTGSKITGSSHTGTVKILEGGLQITNGKISNGKFTIDMTTINNTDLEGGMKQKLENHLKSEDFFDVKKFKTASIRIQGMEGNMVKGDLTIKGITHPISFPAEIQFNEDGSLKATAHIEVDRSKYDVRYGSDSFFDNLGDKAIDNIIQFDVTVIAKAG